MTVSCCKLYIEYNIILNKQCKHCLFNIMFYSIYIIERIVTRYKKFNLMSLTSPPANLLNVRHALSAPEKGVDYRLKSSERGRIKFWGRKHK